MRITVFLIALIAVLLSACKKEDANQSLADKLAGTYQVYDTLTTTSNGVSCPNSEQTNSYYIILTKVNDNTVKIENFYMCGTVNATVTETTIVETTGCGLSGTYSGNTLYMDYAYMGNPSCIYDGRFRAVKQQ